MCRRVAGALITRSAWFVITPWPDDQWVFTVKAGEGTDDFIRGFVDGHNELKGFKHEG